jgi:hypothetical protein
MREVVKVRGVVALELEADARTPERAQHVLDVLKAVAKHQVPAVLEVLPFPLGSGPIKEIPWETDF